MEGCSKQEGCKEVMYIWVMHEFDQVQERVSATKNFVENAIL